MQESRIRVGIGIYIDEYVFRDSKREQRAVNVRRKDLDIPSLYYNEDLVRIGDKAYPFIKYTGWVDLSTHLICPIPGEYDVPERFRAFKEGVLKDNEPEEDGKCVGVRDFEIEGDIVKIVVQKTGYFNFFATNLNLDTYLNQFDPSFGEHEKLRDYEIEDGRVIEPSKSNLANILGIGYLVIPKDKRSTILVEREKSLAVSGGIVSCIGGTPVWNDYSGTISVKEVVSENAEDEMKTELCLKKNEFSVGRGAFINELTRGPGYVVLIQSEKEADAIARRISMSVKAQEEHRALYRVPFHEDALRVLKENRPELRINSSTELFYRWACQLIDT